MSTPTQLYRHFDADGVLLYVGISANAMQRLAGHGSQSSWASRIARVEIENWPTREEALLAEQEAISAEGPLFNRIHRAPLTYTEIGRRMNEINGGRAGAGSVRKWLLGIRPIIVENAVLLEMVTDGYNRAADAYPWLAEYQVRPESEGAPAAPLSPIGAFVEERA